VPLPVRLLVVYLYTNDPGCTLSAVRRRRLLVLRRKPRITLRVDGRRMETASQLGIREGNTGITSSSEDLGADQNATTSGFSNVDSCIDNIMVD
jgi:hypothetical protein